MPSRIIRDSYATSETVAQIEAGAQDRLPRYFLAADDFGCFLAHPAILKGKIYALRDDISAQRVADDLTEFERVGVVRRWKAPDGKTYGHFPSWWEHNRRPRPDAARKTPAPPGEIGAADPPPSRSGPAADPRPQSQSQSHTQDPPVTPRPGGQLNGHVRPVKLQKRRRAVFTLEEKLRFEADKLRNERALVLHEATAHNAMPRDDQLAWCQSRFGIGPPEAEDVVRLVESAKVKAQLGGAR